MLGLENLCGRSFLDVGCGSGLFSLAAHRLGARPVHSIDYDPDSVACTKRLRGTVSDCREWIVKQASILDVPGMSSLGTFDVVYAWGVLHHTGNMHAALDNSAKLVREGGLLFIAIYNDEGVVSSLWRAIKRTYCSSAFGRVAILATVLPGLVFLRGAWDVVRLRNPLKRYAQYPGQARGMRAFRDLIDWIGGYPFEVAKPEEIADFYEKRGFRLCRMTRARGSGCNEFVFELCTA
jgi:2-polyprenyl-3-methyl-5-hydroxy-6-metoxy-1,4-benzoquinol methylase